MKIHSKKKKRKKRKQQKVRHTEMLRRNEAPGSSGGRAAMLIWALASSPTAELLLHGSLGLEND